MQASELKKLYERDMDRLATELESYSNEELLWIKVDGINNSAGNLFMHLCGNLQHFVGTILMNSGYERRRDFEFDGTMSLDEIKADVDRTKQVVVEYLSDADEQSFQSSYPLTPFGYPMSVGYFLIHLHGHLNYHLGQINYHRRILSKTS